MRVHRLLSSALLLTAAALGIMRPSRLTNATPASVDGAPARRVIGYIPTWIRKNGYSTSDIDFSTVNLIAHFSVVPRADGSIEIPDWGPFPDPELVNVAHANRTPIILVVGGDHAAATDGFSAMASNPHARAAFIGELAWLVRVNGYDGVDIDWEFPRSAADRDGLTALISELRAALGPGKTLSIDAPASDYSGEWLDVPALTPYLDWISALTYPLSNASWSTFSGHSSPLYSGVGPEQAAAQGRNNWSSIDSSRAYYLGRGLPASKLLIGLPFFGMRFDSATDIDQPLASASGDAMDYRDVAPLIGNGWTPYLDDGAATPYLVREGGPGLISYDDPASISQKCRYTAADGLGGVILWHLGKDAINGDQPLLRAAAGCR